MGSRDEGITLAAARAVRGNGTIDDAYDAWKQADADARRLEHELRETWRRYERGVGAPPTTGLLRDTAFLRRAAAEKLNEVIELLHASGYIQPATRAAAAARP